jgi:hypothetical protein
MSIFGGADGVKSKQNGEFFAPGEYRVTVMATIAKAQLRKSKQPALIIETRIDEVLAGDAKSNQEGQKTVQILKLESAGGELTEAGERNMSKAKRFFAEVLGGLSTEDVTEEMMTKLTADNGAGIRGTQLRVSATGITTNAGNPFTTVKYGYVPAWNAAA